MDEFGKVYMSTVGCGIVYGKLSGSEPAPSKTTTTTAKATTTTTSTTTAVTSTTDKNYKAGDANCDGTVELADAILIMQSLANPNKYVITEQGKLNGDVDKSTTGLTSNDALKIQEFLLHKIESL